MNLVIKYSIVKQDCDTIALLIPRFQELYKDMLEWQPSAPEPVVRMLKDILDRLLSVYADFMEYESAANIPELKAWKREYVSLSPKQAKELFGVLNDAEEFSRAMVEKMEQLDTQKTSGET